MPSSVSQVRFKPVEFGVVAFQRGHDPHRLRVVIEPAKGRHEGVQRLLAGMAEGRMAQIVGQRHGLGEFRVEPQRSRDRARHLRDFDRMGQARAVIIALVLDEDLRLVLEAPEGRSVDDPVAIALKARAEFALRLVVEPPATFVWVVTRMGSAWFGPPCRRSPASSYCRREPSETGADIMDITLPPTVTDRAYARLAEINEESGDEQALRVAVEGGGCSGFQYDIRLDAPADDDLVLEKNGQRVVVDLVSLPFLANAVIDFSEELIGARFTIENPNAASSCGCGTSFSI